MFWIDSKINGKQDLFEKKTKKVKKKFGILVDFRLDVAAMSGASTVSAFRPSTEPLIFLGMACMKVGLSTIYQLNYDYFADLNGFDVGNN